MNESMTRQERKAVTALASIISTRMLGLFLILPVFAIYAHSLSNVTRLEVGIAIGIYGLTQAIFQIPMGMLSDRWGRKPVIVIGLLIFASGSVVAALSDSIMGIIIGRALQGVGAIASAVLAMTADLTSEEHRTKAMATIGISIGMSFMFALMLGPILHHWIGMQGIFWFIAVLALLAIAILYFIVPTPKHTSFHRDAEPVPTQFKKVLMDTQLLRLDVGILILHFLLAALFVELPILLIQTGLIATHHWQVYFPVLLVAMILMVPFIIYAEKYRHLKLIFASAVIGLLLAQLGFMYFYQNLLGIVCLLVLFFTAFNILEASLPSLVSKFASPESKGTAMGVYTTSQFLGTFLGGLTGGWLHSHYPIEFVFGVYAVVALVWFLFAVTMKKPPYLINHLLYVGNVNEQEATQLTERLKQLPGVAEVVIIIEDGIAYLKVDKKRVDFATLNQFSVVHE